MKPREKAIDDVVKRGKDLIQEGHPAPTAIEVKVKTNSSFMSVLLFFLLSKNVILGLHHCVGNSMDMDMPVTDCVQSTS